MSQAIIIVGAGLAGWTTARELRKLDPTTPVVLIAADSGDVYAKPALSNAFAGRRAPQQLVSTGAAAMAQTLKLTLHAHTEVLGIDPAARTVRIRNAQHTETLDYSALVLATGAAPIRPPMGGDAADLALSVNSLDDFAILHARLHRGAVADTPRASDIVIIGAGLIGCEFANDLALAGHRVHVVDPSARPLAAMLPELAGLQLQQALGELGVAWHFGATATHVDRQADPVDLADPASARLKVRLSDGGEIDADSVISAVGLRANLALASGAGIACERGIVVDVQLRTSAPDIYALGDCAQYDSAGQRTLPYVMPIMAAAKALAATLAGHPTVVSFALMPVSIKTPSLPVVAALPHPAQAGQWIAGEGDDTGLWRFVDTQGGQRGFVLTGKQTTRRAELAGGTVL